MNTTQSKQTFEAIQAMRNLAFSESIRRFQHVLRQLHAATQHKEPTNEGSKFVQFEVVTVNVKLPRPYNANQPCLIDHNTIEVYSRAVHWHVGDAVDAHPTRLRCCIGLILFNMGLAFHLWTLSTAQHRNSKLQRALRLYKLAILSIQSVYDEEPSSAKIGTLKSFVQLISYQNMTNIYAHFFANTEIGQCHHEMMKAFADIFASSEESPAIVLHIDKGDLLEIWFNLSIYTFGMSKASPVA